MKAITLSNGLTALVDDEDFQTVAAYRWQANQHGNGWRAARHTRRADGSKTKQYMHQLLMPGVALVDHINGNALDNRRANLRPATRAGNSRNQRRRHDNRSGFKGVSWEARRGAWRAYIRADGRQIHLGQFHDPSEAARAYDNAARRLHGAFAALNFPAPEEVSA